MDLPVTVAFVGGAAGAAAIAAAAAGAAIAAAGSGPLFAGGALYGAFEILVCTAIG